MSNDLTCWCLGIDLRTECGDPATQEDGLCDGCRIARCEGDPAGTQMRRVIEELGFGGERELPPFMRPLREPRNV